VLITFEIEVPSLVQIVHSFIFCCHIASSVCIRHSKSVNTLNLFTLGMVVTY